MKNIFFIITFIAILSACEKSEPEIATYDDLSSIAYLEKIYTQPINVNNQIVSAQKRKGDFYLTAFDSKGSVIWDININNYCIEGYTYDNIPLFELKKNKQNEIFLNFYAENQQNSEIIKVVRFSSKGEFISEFQDSIHQKNPTTPQEHKFAGLSILPLENGNVATISTQTLYANKETLIQTTEYNVQGEIAKDTIYRIPEAFNPFDVFAASNNRFVFAGESGFTVQFIIFNPAENTFYKSPELPVFDIFSFYENSNGDFIFTASAFVGNLQYIGMIISISQEGEYLWHSVYGNKTAWLLTSITELADGYIFTGFDLTGQLLTQFDWRTSLDDKKAVGIMMKTNLRGVTDEQTGWTIRLTTPAVTAGANVLEDTDDNFTLFAAKYDRDIHSTMILKIDKQGNIVDN